MGQNKIIPTDTNQITAYNFTKARIEIIKHFAAGLSVTGVKDHKGLQKVVSTRKRVKKIRLEVGKRRVDLNAELLQKMRKNNAEAKFITTELLPVEKALHLMEKDIANQKQELKLEKQRLALARIQGMIDRLAPFNVVPELEVLQKMTDGQFETYLSKVQFDFEAEKQRKATEAASLTRQNELLAEENAKLKSQQTQTVENTPPAAQEPPKQPEPTPGNGISSESRETAVNALKIYCLAIENIIKPDLSRFPDLNKIFVQGNHFITHGIDHILKETL